tara:strand:- start:7395 stop:8957 length:1563 start_codon:yes stop_codon:yes gene_type:complete
MNIVWIFIDSVRRYYSEDDRSRLPFMDEFAKSSISLNEVVTSAPSTVMSISAMMTGRHSFILGANYNDFRHDRKAFPTLTSILKENGWDCYAALMHPEIREKLTCLNMYPRKKWPKGFSHAKWWTNQEIYNFLEKILPKTKNNLPNKKFWFVDYNCRKDPNISDLVEKTFKLFYKNGFTHDNTIFCLCSDHGYPDPSRGITPELLKQKRMTHDIFMTDDNIMIPFFLSLPGFPKNVEYNNQISTLNIFPTILDYLNIKSPKASTNYHESLLDYLKLLPNQDSAHQLQFARCDARFLGQSDRVCSIRGDNHKLVYMYENKKFSYYLINGLEEKEISLDNQEESVKIKFNKLKSYFDSTEKIPTELLKEKISQRIDKIISNIRKEKISIHLLSNSLDQYNNIVIELLEKYAKDFKEFNIYFNPSYISKENLEVDNITFSKETKRKYDIKILLQTDGKELSRVNKSFRKIKAKRKLIISTSITGEITKRRYTRALKTIWNSRVLYFYEPWLIIKLFIRLIKHK